MIPAGRDWRNEARKARVGRRHPAPSSSSFVRRLVASSSSSFRSFHLPASSCFAHGIQFVLHCAGAGGVNAEASSLEKNDSRRGSGCHAETKTWRFFFFPPPSLSAAAHFLALFRSTSTSTPTTSFNSSSSSSFLPPRFAHPLPSPSLSFPKIFRRSLRAPTSGGTRPRLPRC